MSAGTENVDYRILNQASARITFNEFLT